MYMNDYIYNKDKLFIKLYEVKCELYYVKSNKL